MKKYIFILVALSAFLLGAVPAMAQSAQSSLRVSPVILNVDLSPGKIYNYDVSVTNLSNTPLPVLVSFDNFETDEDGKEFTFPANVDNSILSWVSVDNKDLLIPANSRKIVHLKITLPKQIPLGGYYGVMFVEPVLSKTANTSLVSAKVGILMLANIGVTDKQNLIELAESTFNKGFYMSGPVNQVLRIKNNSLNHFSVKPKLVIEPLFGKKTTIDYEEKVIFPGKIRRWNKTFELPDYFHGFYKTTLLVSTGNGKQQSYSSYILAFPLIPAIIVLVIITIVIFGLTNRGRVKKAIRILFSTK